VSKYIPVVVFCFDRPLHLKKMLESIGENKESQYTDAYFFVDGPRNDKETILIDETVSVINSLRVFKEQKIIQRDKNLGMQQNVIRGITEVLSNNEAVIVLEDDLKFSEYYLEYMNNALNFYRPYENVWHINGWSYPNYVLFKNKTSVSYQMSSWGMGLYKDKWEVFAKDQYGLTNKVSEKDSIFKKDFNFGNSYNWVEEIEMNDTGRLNTFSCFWYQCIYLNKGVTIYPSKSLIFNTGNDGSGINSGNNSKYDTKIFHGRIKNYQLPVSYDPMFKLNAKIFYRKIKTINYFNYHKTKFLSLENFLTYLKSKLK